MSKTRQIENDTVRAFAEANLDDHTLESLLADFGGLEACAQHGIDAVPDAVDCRTWGITEAQWLQAVMAAVEDLAADAVLDVADGCKSNGVSADDLAVEFTNDLDASIDGEGDITTANGALDLQNKLQFLVWATGK